MKPSLLLAVVVQLLGACERAPSPIASRPAPEPAPAPQPVREPLELPFVEPVYETQTLPRLDLPEIAGVQYLEVVTGDAAPSAELPMIVVLHGHGSYPGLMADRVLTSTGSTAQPVPPFSGTARFIFLCGSRSTNSPGDARWFSVTANEGTSGDELTELSRQIEARSQTVADAITGLTEARPTIGKPIIIGHSQGGILTFALAVEHPELFAAAYPVSGWLPEPLRPRKRADKAAGQLPIIVMHGDADTFVSIEQTQRGVERLERLGYDITLISHPGSSDSSIPMLADLRERLAERAFRLSSGEPR